MIDYQELKRLAEAATPGKWSTSGSYVAPSREEPGGTVYVESWRPIALASDDIDREFIAAANPAALLELIADNEKLLNLINRMIDQYVPLVELEGMPGYSRAVELVELAGERDQLKAEVDALVKQGTEYRSELHCLSTEVEDVRKDAERFRYLRDKCQDISIGDGGKFDFPDFAGISFSWRRREWINGKPFVALELNEAIDAAMSKESGQ